MWSQNKDTLTEAISEIVKINVCSSHNELINIESKAYFIQITV